MGEIESRVVRHLYIIVFLQSIPGSQSTPLVFLTFPLKSRIYAVDALRPSNASAETLKLEEQREWQIFLKRLKESKMILAQQIEQLENDMQSSQLSDNDSDDITQDHLQQLVRRKRTCRQPLAATALRSHTRDVHQV